MSDALLLPATQPYTTGPAPGAGRSPRSLIGDAAQHAQHHRVAARSRRSAIGARADGGLSWRARTDSGRIIPRGSAGC